MAVKPIPDGYHPITPYLVVEGAARALDFYRKALGAEETVRMPEPGGRIAHAEMRIGASTFMLADENPGIGRFGPRHYQGTPVSLMLYVDDVDQVFARAVAAGAKVERPIENQFYGDRSGNIVDPFGHRWLLATHVEDVPPEEMARRMKAMQEKGS